MLRNQKAESDAALDNMRAELDAQKKSFDDHKAGLAASAAVVAAAAVAAAANINHGGRGRGAGNGRAPSLPRAAHAPAAGDVDMSMRPGFRPRKTAKKDPVHLLLKFALRKLPKTLLLDTTLSIGEGTNATLCARGLDIVMEFKDTLKVTAFHFSESWLNRTKGSIMRKERY